MPNTNSNTPEGETNSQELPECEIPSQETSQSIFDSVPSLLDEHLGSSRVRIDSDFELSKKCFTPVITQNDPVIDGSNFAGKDHTPFDKKVEPPVAIDGEKTPLRKGIDYRDNNISSLL